MDCSSHCGSDAPRRSGEQRKEINVTEVNVLWTQKRERI